jgi:hypothetical protein
LLLGQIWQVAGIAFALMVLTGVLSYSARKWNLVFGPLAIITVFLGKGTNPPLGDFYIAASHTIPYFILLHEPNKIILLASYSYTILFGIFLTAVLRHLTSKARGWSLNPAYHSPSLILLKRSFKKVFKASVLILLCLPIATFSSPFFSGDFAGNLRAIDFPQSYADVNQWLSTQNNFFYVLWLPADPYTQYKWIPMYYQQHDLMAQYSPKPSFSAEDVPGEQAQESRTDYFVYYVISALYSDNARFIPQILGKIGVKYILNRRDAESWWWRNLDPSRFNQDLSGVLQELGGLTLVKRFGNIDVYQNAFFRDSGFITGTSGIALAAGGRSVMSLDSNGTDFVGNSTLAFAGQISNETMGGIYGTIDRLILDENDFRDIAFSFLPLNRTFDAASYISEGDPSATWSKLFADFWWYNHDFLDTLDEAAVTEASGQTMKIPFVSDQNEEYDIWIRLLTGNSSIGTEAIGHLAVLIDGVPTAVLEPGSGDYPHYDWLQAGSIGIRRGPHELEIDNLDGFNIVDRIVIAPTREVARALDDYQRLLNSVQCSLIYSVGSNERIIQIPKQSYYRIFLQFDTDSPVANDTSIRVGFVHSNRTIWRDALMNGGPTTQLGSLALDKGTYDVLLLSNRTAKLLLVEENSNEIGGQGRESVELTYAKLNPVAYQLSIRAKSSYVVVTMFNSFDDSWGLDENVIDHFVSYSFANSFLLGSRGNGTLSLQYDYQKTFVLMNVLSTAGLLFGVTLFLGPYLTKRRKNMKRRPIFLRTQIGCSASDETPAGCPTVSFFLILLSHLPCFAEHHRNVI